MLYPTVQNKTPNRSIVQSEVLLVAGHATSAATAPLAEVPPGSAQLRHHGEAAHPPEPGRLRHRQGRRAAEGVPRQLWRRHQGLPAVLPPVDPAHCADDRRRQRRDQMHHFHLQAARRRKYFFFSFFSRQWRDQMHHLHLQAAQ